MTAAFDLLDASPRMIYEIAAGLEDPVAIAERYGVSREVLEQLWDHPVFQNRRENARQELEAHGHSVRFKAKEVYEMALNRIATDISKDDLPVNVRLDVMKHLAEIADLKPKQNVPAPGAEKFGIQIIVNQQTVVEPPRPDVITVDVTPDGLPARPPALDRLIMQLPLAGNDDLAAGATDL